MLKRRVPNALI